MAEEAVGRKVGKRNAPIPGLKWRWTGFVAFVGAILLLCREGRQRADLLLAILEKAHLKPLELPGVGDLLDDNLCGSWRPAGNEVCCDDGSRLLLALSEGCLDHDCHEVPAVGIAIHGPVSRDLSPEVSG